MRKARAIRTRKFEKQQVKPNECTTTHVSDDEPRHVFQQQLAFCVVSVTKSVERLIRLEMHMAK